MPQPIAPRRGGSRPRGQPLRAFPFGTPDGARAGLKELEAGFVDFSPVRYDALALQPNDHTARIIVGKMGVGKTLYLRRFRAAAADNDALYADKVRGDDLPSTEDVIRTSQRFKVPFVTEAWQRIWRRAVIRTVVSHIACTSRLSSHLDDGRLDWVNEYGDLLPAFDSPSGIGGEVRDIIRTYHARDLLWNYLEERRWTDVEDRLAQVLHNCPPIHLYLDAVDEQFSRAPMYWLKCQKGLFYAVIGLLRNEDFNRLHVVVGVRDVVLSAVLRDEHAGRYRDEPHIRLLEWDHESICYFLNAKIEQLGPDHKMRPRVRGLAGWLGCSEFVNHVRGTTETVEDYLLRHTRLIPRDVVTLGNAMCQQVAKAKARGFDHVSNGVIWQVVDRAAKQFAEQQLGVCANQITADMMPAHSAEQGYADFYVGSSEYSQGNKQELCQILSGIARDRFGEDAVAKIRSEGEARFDGYEHVADVLWQNGLLGFELDSSDPGRAHFYTASEADDFGLPERKSYVLHPSLGHRLGLRAVGSTPVRGYPSD